MKKTIAFILIAAMSVGTLCSCSTEETTVVTSEETAIETTTEETTTSSETTETTVATTVETTVPDYPKSPDTPAIDGYNLIWSDEFDGDELDKDIWSIAFTKPRANNNELQAYRISDENVFVKDGKLYLKATREFNKNNEPLYYSGKVYTERGFSCTYGKIVVSAQVPEGRGLWPAAWLLPVQGGKYGTWPRSGEIDIMELLGNDPKTAYSTIHYGNPHQQQQGTLKLDGKNSFAKGFHEYSVEWEPGEMRFYIDDQEVLVTNEWYTSNGSGEADNFPAPFDQPFYMILNLAVGGDWPGDPDEKTDFDNADFIIDYVRVYQLPEYK